MSRMVGDKVGAKVDAILGTNLPAAPEVNKG